jgi:hypothetical protein
MVMTPDVVQVKALPDYSLEAVFANGECRRFDMKPYLSYPAWSKLTEANFFLKAHVAYGAVVTRLISRLIRSIYGGCHCEWPSWVGRAGLRQATIFVKS